MVVISWVVSGSVCVGVPFQCGYGGVVSFMQSEDGRNNGRNMLSIE